MVADDQGIVVAAADRGFFEHQLVNFSGKIRISENEFRHSRMICSIRSVGDKFTDVAAGWQSRPLTSAPSPRPLASDGRGRTRNTLFSILRFHQYWFRAFTAGRGSCRTFVHN